MVEIEIDCDDVSGDAARRILQTRLRPMLPMLDPDGRGNVRVRVSRLAGSERTRVEIVCSTPKVSADVSANSATGAIHRAVGWLAAQLRAVRQEDLSPKLAGAGRALSEPPPPP